MASVPPEVEQPPFGGYARVVGQKKEEEGQQKKGSDTAEYECEVGGTTTKYFIKRASTENVDDDVAELVTSRLNLLAMGEEHTVEYIAVRNERDDSVYVASAMTDGLKPLKKVVKLPVWVPSADLIWDANKNAVYNKLSKEQRKGMARVLAGSLWARDIDCQYGNVLVDATGNVVKKFDNGWGLSEICMDGHAQVKLFETQSPIKTHKVGTHGKINIPTNHFNDYPQIVRSQSFVEALQEVVEKTTDVAIDDVVEKSVDEIRAAYKAATPDAEHVLGLFCKHIGLDITKKPTDKSIDDFIKESLKKRLKERAASMAVLQRMLAIDLALNDKENPPDSKKLAKLVGELKTVIQQKFKEKFKENPHIRIDEILPPYDPPFVKLMQKSIKLMKKGSSSSSSEEREASSFCKAFCRAFLQKPDAEPPSLLFQDVDKKPPLIFTKKPHKTNTKTEEAQTYQTFSTYCDSLMEGLKSKSPALSEGQKSLEIESSGQKITVTHLPNNAINTSLPDNLEKLKKVFPQVLAANIKAGLTHLSPNGCFKNVEYMTEEILKQELTPVFTRETKKLLKAHGLNEVRFIANIQAKIAVEKASDLRLKTKT